MHGTLALHGIDGEVLGGCFTPTHVVPWPGDTVMIFAMIGSMRTATLAIGCHAGVHLLFVMNGGSLVYRYRSLHGSDRGLSLDFDGETAAFDAMILVPWPADTDNHARGMLELSGCVCRRSWTGL